MSVREIIQEIIERNYKVGDSFTTYQIYCICKRNLTNKKGTGVIPTGTINGCLNFLCKKGIVTNRDPDMTDPRDARMIRSKRQKIWIRVA